MYEDRKVQALEAWHLLLSQHSIRMTAQEQYEELLSLAERYMQQNIINREERNVLVIKATDRYAIAVEGLGQGT